MEERHYACVAINYKSLTKTQRSRYFVMPIAFMQPFENVGFYALEDDRDFDDPEFVEDLIEKLLYEIDLAMLPVTDKLECDLQDYAKGDDVLIRAFELHEVKPEKFHEYGLKPELDVDLHSM